MPPTGDVLPQGITMTITKRLSIFVLLLMAFTTVFAQKTKTMPAKAQTVYACDHCMLADSKAGKCSMCKMPKMKTKATVVYHCDHCNKDMTKGGMCPACKGKTTKMAVYYECDHCKTTSEKSGKCTKCKMEMTKHTAKMK